jgi:hypothetical protein
MAQDLTVNIKTTSDVPQAMDKAKVATGSFQKQVEDVGRKFSTAFKDIALGFIAPMVIFQNLLQFIKDDIERAKQDAKDGLDLLAKGDTAYATSEEKKMASFYKAKQEREAEMELAKKGREEIARQFIKTEAGRRIAYEEIRVRGAFEKGFKLEDDPNFQRRALESFLASPEGQNFKPIFEEQKKEKDFKGPEGFSNVIGVGPNPVMEAMARQIEIQEQQLAELQKISGSTPAGQGDFTKGTQSK